MSVPCFAAHELTPAALRSALTSSGCLQIAHPRLSPARLASVLDDARAFFALPREHKLALGIEGSPHFRGYSEMRNARDFREQIHFGDERSVAGVEPGYLQLEGPNMWPADAGFRQRMLAYLGDVASVAHELLARIVTSLGLSDDLLREPLSEPYLLMKLIGYHPQPRLDAKRPGVAAHVDFSWLTLTLQDGIGGLELARPDGTWIAPPPTPGVLLVHVGELLQFTSRGVFLATPHRVINPSSERMRASIPTFFNAGLRARVESWSVAPPAQAMAAGSAREHVHRFLDPSVAPAPFVFGEAEWRRKGQNLWCFECCAQPSDPDQATR